MFKGISLIILLCTFLSLLVFATLKLAQKETGSRTYIEDAVSTSMFPSFTMCPYLYKGAKSISFFSNYTFEDLQNLPSIQDNVVANLLVSRSYDTR